MRHLIACSAFNAGAILTTFMTAALATPVLRSIDAVPINCPANTVPEAYAYPNGASKFLFCHVGSKDGPYVLFVNWEQTGKLSIVSSLDDHRQLLAQDRYRDGDRDRSVRVNGSTWDVTQWQGDGNKPDTPVTDIGQLDFAPNAITGCNSNRIGKWTSYYPDGTFAATTIYVPPTPNDGGYAICESGTLASYQLFDKDTHQKTEDDEYVRGFLSVLQSWTASGVPIAEQHYTTVTEGGPIDIVHTIVPDGIQRGWYSNKQLARSMNWVKGVPDGPYSVYKPDGTLIQSGTFQGGNGDVLSVNNNGVVVIREHWAGGAISGLTLRYRDDGTLAGKESYRAGKRDGLWETYDADGTTVLTQKTFVSDHESGLSKEWSPLGVLLTITCYSNDEALWNATSEAEAASKTCP